MRTHTLHVHAYLYASRQRIRAYVTSVCIYEYTPPPMCLPRSLRSLETCPYAPSWRASLARGTCPCAWVNGVSGPFFREGGLWLPSQIFLFACTACRQCSQFTGCVYLRCTVSTDYTRVDMYVHGVYKLCKVSRKLCKVSRKLCTVQRVYKLCTVSTWRQGDCRLYVHAKASPILRIHGKMHTRIRAYTYTSAHCIVEHLAG